MLTEIDSKFKFEQGKFTEGPNGRINYSLSFPGGDRTAYKGPLVVCFHGLMSSISSFSHLEKECVRSGLAVLRIDMPGHGLSSWSYFGKLTPEDFVCQVDTVVSNQGLEGYKLYLVGFSMGGLMTLHYALAHPEKVLKVAAISPACFCRPLSFPQKSSISYAPGLVRFLYNSVPFHLFVTRDSIVDDYFSPDNIDPNLIDTRYQRHKYYGRQLRSTFGRIITGFNFWNNQDLLQSFASKYLSIRGDTGILFFLSIHDDVVPYDELVPKLKDIIPQTKTLIYDNCKHQILEEGQHIIRDILAYLNSTSSIGTSFANLSVPAL